MYPSISAGTNPGIPIGELSITNKNTLRTIEASGITPHLSYTHNKDEGEEKGA